MSNTYSLLQVMPFKYLAENSIKADVAEEKICSFFHANAVSISSVGKSGINRSPS